MPANTPDQTVAEAIAKALVAAELLAPEAEQGAVVKIAGGQVTSTDWQAYLKPSEAASNKDEQPKA